MQLKTAGILTIVSALGLAPAANAGTLMDFYAGASVGAGAVTVFDGGDNHTDSAMSYGAIVGIDIPLVRIEGEYNYLNDTDIKLNTAMLNAYFKMPSVIIQPYLGVGVGTIFNGKADSIDISTKGAYQAMLGITFDTPALPLKFDIEGRALYSPNLFTVEESKPDFLHYDLRLKLRFVF